MKKVNQQLKRFKFWQLKSKKKLGKQLSIDQNKKRILDLGNQSISQLRVVSIIISFLFTYLAINNPFKKIFTEQISVIEFSFILKLLLILLFYSKLSGILTDIRELQRELKKIPHYKLSLGIYISSIAYSLVFIMLLFLVDNFIVFCSMLSFLYIIYMLFWQALTKFSTQCIKETYKHNISNQMEVEKLQNKIMYSYFSGYWVKDVVYYVIMPSLLGIILFASNYDLRIDGFLKITSRCVVMSILIFIGVFISEMIVWTKRFKRKYQIRYLDQNYETIARRLRHE